QGNQTLFTAEALWRIVCSAKGLPRAVNLLCTNALIAGCEAQRKPITAALVQRAIADTQGRRRIPAWQLGLASAAALALLGSLLWLAPWLAKRDAPILTPQAMLSRISDRTATKAIETAAPAVPSPIPEAETNYGEHDAQKPALMIQMSAASGGVLAQQPVTDTQVMQGPVARPEPASPTHEEHLGTHAMDKLLASLEPADKAALRTTPRSKAARRRGTKSLQWTAAGRGVSSFASAPGRSDPVPPVSVPDFQFFNAHDPRARVDALRTPVRDSSD